MHCSVVCKFSAVVFWPTVFSASLVCIAFSSEACGQTGSWERHAIDAELRGADGVRLADANGDGLLDIVTGWEESGATRAYFNPGAKQAKSAWPRVDVGLSPSIEDAVWVDLNGDQRLDILSSCEGKEQSLRFFLAPASEQMKESEEWMKGIVLASKSKTRWMFATPLEDPASKPEKTRLDSQAAQPKTIVLGSKNPNGMVALLKPNSQQPQHSEIETIAQAGWIMSIFATDVDGDGDDDVLYSDRKSATAGIYWLENPNGPGVWTRHVVGQLGQEVMFMSTPKLEGNRLHLSVSVKPNRIVSLKQAEDSREPWEEIRALQTPDWFGTAKGVAVADLDFDGDQEIVFSCEQATGAKAGVGLIDFDSSNGATFSSVSGSAGIKFDLVELIDLDGDGDLDILTCEEREAGRGLGVIWYANPLR